MRRRETYNEQFHSFSKLCDFFLIGMMNFDSPDILFTRFCMLFSETPNMSDMNPEFINMARQVNALVPVCGRCFYSCS